MHIAIYVLFTMVTFSNLSSTPLTEGMTCFLFLSFLEPELCHFVSLLSTYPSWEPELCHLALHISLSLSRVSYSLSLKGAILSLSLQRVCFSLSLYKACHTLSLSLSLEPSLYHFSLPPLSEDCLSLPISFSIILYAVTYVPCRVVHPLHLPLCCQSLHLHPPPCSIGILPPPFTPFIFTSCF